MASGKAGQRSFSEFQEDVGGNAPWRKVARLGAGFPCNSIAEKFLLDFSVALMIKQTVASHAMGGMSGSFPQNSPLQNFPAALREFA